MTCRELADFPYADLAGELDPGLRGEFEGHLGVSRECRDSLATYRATSALGHQAFTDPEADAQSAAPEDFVAAILESCRR
jgi:anti-sigma factor RsiW